MFSWQWSIVQDTLQKEPYGRLWGLRDNGVAFKLELKNLELEIQEGGFSSQLSKVYLAHEDLSGCKRLRAEGLNQH